MRPDMFARPSSSSASSADKSHKSSSPPSSPRTRKRSLTPATVDDDDDDDDQDEARPTKKIRFADSNMVEPRAARLSSRRPISPRATRVRKGHPPSIPQSSQQSTVPTATMALSPPTASTVPRLSSVDESSNDDPVAQFDTVSTLPPIHSRHSGQHTGSDLIHPDEKDDQGNNNTREKRDMGPAVSAPDNGNCRPRPRKRIPPSSASTCPRTKNSSRILKSTSSRLERRAARTTKTGQASINKGAAHQTRSSRRLERRGQGGGSFHELDPHGKARSLVS